MWLLLVLNYISWMKHFFVIVGNSANKREQLEFICMWVFTYAYVKTTPPGGGLGEVGRQYCSHSRVHYLLFNTITTVKK